MVKLSGQFQRNVKDCMARKNEMQRHFLLISTLSPGWWRAKKKLVADVVGHVPQEISRFLYFFLHHVRSIDAVVEDEKNRPSLIAKGGLEIVLRPTFKIDDSKRSLLHRLKELIEKNYELLYESATDEEESLASDLSIHVHVHDWWWSRRGLALAMPLGLAQNM